MKNKNFTIDNQFRNPFRWGRCPIGIGRIIVFGFSYKKELDPYRIGHYKSIIFYFWRWYYQIIKYYENT